MAQSLEHQTLDFGSGHDLTVPEIKPRVRFCTDSMEPAWDSLSLPPPALPHSYSKEINTHLKKIHKAKTELKEKHTGAINGCYLTIYYSLKIMQS